MVMKTASKGTPTIIHIQRALGSFLYLTMSPPQDSSPLGTPFIQPRAPLGVRCGLVCRISYKAPSPGSRYLKSRLMTFGSAVGQMTTLLPGDVPRIFLISNIWPPDSKTQRSCSTTALLSSSPPPLFQTAMYNLVSRSTGCPL